MIAPTRADDAASAEERRLGRVSLLGKNYDEAITHFNKALESNPNDAATWIDRAECWSSKGSENRAVEDLSRAIEIEPRNAKARVGRAEALVERDVDRAVADLDVALSVDPKNAKAYGLRGYVYFGRGDLDRASPDLDSAIRLGLGSELSEVFLFRAMIRLSRNEGEGAILDIDKLIEASPGEPGFLFFRAMAHCLRRQDERAIVDCDRCLENKPGDPQISLLRAILLQRAKRNAEAKQVFDGIIERTPDDPEALALRGSLALTEGKPAQAIADLDRAVACKPDEPRYRIHRERIKAKHGDYAGALADCSLVVHRDPGQLKVADKAIALGDQAWIWATCPEARFRSGAKAVESARQACELTDWKAPWLIITLSAAHAEVGDFDQAIGRAEEAAKLPPKDEPLIQVKVERFKVSVAYSFSSEGSDSVKQDLEAAMAAYRKRRPYRDPR